MNLQIIAAVAENGVIGCKGRLPWHLPADLRRFRDLTMGHVLIMGRRTFESLPGRLPGRPHVVVSRTLLAAPEGVTVVRDLDAAVEVAARLGDGSPFVIGGAAVFAAAYPRASRIHLTRVCGTFEGDTRMPPLPEDLRRVDRTPHPADAHHRVAMVFETYER